MSTTHVSAGRRRRQRLRRLGVVGVLLLGVGGAGGYAAWRADHATATSTVAAAPSALRATPAPGSARATPRHPTAAKPPRSTGFAPVVTDRIPPPQVAIPLDRAVPGLTNMQPSARRAFERAFAAARADGLRPQVRSAWRSAAYQQVLFDRAVRLHGSAQEAARWVLTPQRSAHVKGYAVDVHPAAVATWLEAHGPAFGICRTYDNEWWHFEYRATSHCPARLPSAAG